MFKNSKVKNLLNVRDILFPLLFIYVSVYILLQQDIIESTSKIILIIKLALGSIILGGYPLYIIKKHKLDKKLFGLIFPKFNTHLLILSILFGSFLYYFYLYMYNEIFNILDIARFAYFAPFNYLELSFFIIVLLIPLVSLAEEIFFRGFLYTYLKSKMNKMMAFLIAVIAFTIAHLSLEIPLIITLILLSIFSLLLFEKTKTLFYGFIAHAVLNTIAVLGLTTGIENVILKDANLKFFILLTITIFYFFIVFKKQIIGWILKSKRS